MKCMKLDLNTNDLIKAAIVVIIGGVVLLGVLTILTPLLPLIAVAVVLVLAYFIYQWVKQGKIKL